MVKNIKGYYSYLFLILFSTSCVTTAKYKKIVFENEILKKQLFDLKKDSTDLAKKLILKQHQIQSKESSLNTLKQKIKSQDDKSTHEIIDLKNDETTVLKYDYKNKATYIYNFAQNVHWESLKNESKYKIAVLNNDQLKKSLDDIFKNKMVSGKTAQIELINMLDIVKDKYQLIIFDIKSKEFLENNIKKINMKNCLVITDGFLYNDCNCISLFEANSQLKFEIMKDTLKKNKFLLSNTIQYLK